MSELVRIGPRQEEWQEPRPEIGGTEFLVYGECECGWRCACPEMARWPKCPLCDEQVMPPPAGPVDEGVSGSVISHPLIRDTLEPRLGYVAKLLAEQDALFEARGRRGTRILIVPASDDDSGGR